MQSSLLVCLLWCSASRCFTSWFRHLSAFSTVAVFHLFGIANTMVLEFVFSTVIGANLHHLRRLPIGLGLGLVAIGSDRGAGAASYVCGWAAIDGCAGVGLLVYSWLERPIGLWTRCPQPVAAAV
jgi:hypothetical protein